MSRFIREQNRSARIPPSIGTSFDSMSNAEYENLVRNTCLEMPDR
jgi:hypothetical protein